MSSTSQSFTANGVNGKDAATTVELSTDDLRKLFPLPNGPTSSLSPLRVRGVHYEESAETTRRLLQDNHERWHVMFNDLGYHNHASHHILAAYALGAPKDLIEAVYPIHTWYQRPLASSPEVITESNFLGHLGDPKFYHSYASFFRTLILGGASASSLLEKFIFLEKYNVRRSEAEANPPSSEHPHMLARLLASVFHPFIHLGNACEFGSSGLLAEGLAEACVHPPDIESVLTSGFLGFDGKRHSDSNQLSSTKSHRTHLLTVLASICTDSHLVLDFEGLDGIQKFHLVMEKCGHTLRQYVDQWIDVGECRDEVEGCGSAISEDVKDLLEQLIWAVSLIYGVSGWRGAERGFLPDFFCVHVLTASLFLHSILPHLRRTSQLTLLRTFLLQALVWWMSRGRNPIDISAYYDGVGSACPVGAYPFIGAGGAVGSEEVDEPVLVELMPEQVLADEHAGEGRIALAAAAGELPTYEEFATVRGRAQHKDANANVERTSTPVSGSTSDEDEGDVDAGEVPSTPMTSASESSESLPQRPLAKSTKAQLDWNRHQDAVLTQSLRPSPWTTILSTALVHPEEHVVKTMRALSHYSQLWGARRSAGDAWFWGGCAVGCAGSDAGFGPHHHLTGLERLDGTLFVRTAGMTMDRLGWMREGEKIGQWSGRSKSALAMATLTEQKKAELENGGDVSH